MHCLTFVVNSNIFMANGALNQGAESSPHECRSWPAAAWSRAARGSASPVTGVRFARAPSISLEEASQLDRPVEIPEATVSVTLKLPPRTVELLRKYARSSGLTIGAIVTAALNAFLRTLKRHG